MNVTCSSCNTQYKIDETKVPPSGGFIKCKTCGERVKIPPPGDAIPLAGTDAPAQAPQAIPDAAPPAPQAPSPEQAPPAGAIPLAGSEAPAPPTAPSETPAAPTPPAGAIPLAGSEAPAPPTAPSEIPAPAPPAGAIPLAGSEAPAPPAGAIPLAGTEAPTPPAPAGAIPLAGTEAPTAPAAGAIPLANEAPGAIPLAGSDTPDDEAPTVVSTTSGAIPLAGTTDEAPTVVASTPSLPRTGPAPQAPTPPAAVPVDEEAPTVVASTPSLPRSGGAIPLAGADDEAPTAIGPAPQLADLPPDEEAPTQVTDTPKFLDNVPPTSEPLDDLPAALSNEETAGATDPDTPALSETQPDAAAVESSLFDDLPAVSTGEVTDDAPTVDLTDNLPAPTEGAAPALDDLPAADIPLMDDLPAADAPSLMDDLPAAEAPSLMDDLPATQRDANTSVSTLDGEAMTAPSLGETPSLMLDDPLAEDQSSAPAIHPADLGLPPADGAAAEPAPEDGPRAPAGKGRLIAIAGGGAAVLLLAAFALTTPYLGVQLVDPFGLVEKTDPQPSPEEIAKAKAKAKAKAEAKAKAKTKEPEPPPEPELVELSTENVDKLGYAALRDATAAFAADADASDAEAQGLLAWARFRLAAIYGDKEAREALTASLPKGPKEVPKLEGLAIPAAIGGMALAGKSGPARKVGERMAKGRHRTSPQLAIALSTAYTKRPETPKALRHLDRASKLAPDLPDVALRRGRLLLSGRDPAAGAKALVELTTSASDDPDLAVLVADALLNAQRADALNAVAARLNDAKQIERVAPTRRDRAWQLLCNQAVRTGNLKRAVEIAEKRVEASSSLDARILLARLTAAAGGDSDAVLTKKSEKRDPADAARVAAERVRLALRKNDVKAAKAALKGVPAKKTGGWVKLAEGWIARHEKQASAAKSAFNAAAKAKLPEARLEVALLSEDDKALLKKLSDVEKKSGLPIASYRLAQVMKERGNLRGAADLMTRVVWTDPTVVEPIDLVLEWADLMAQTGHAELAMTTVTELRENQPEDPRPVLALIELKRRAGAHDEVVELYRGLVKANPKDSSLKVGLAAALNRAGSHSQAQGTLEDMFKEDKKARTPEAILELARAWADREPYRARQLVKESIESKATAEKYNLLGQLAIKRDQIDEARKAYEKALELDPKFVESHVALARIHLEAREYDDVVAELEKVLTEVPNHRDAASTLGDVYVELNKPREAIKRYEIALSSGDDEELLMKVARLQLQRLGQLGPAIASLRRVIAINPELAEAHFHLGMALKDQGKKREAIASLKKCVAVNPEGDWATEANTTLQDLQK